MASATVFFSHGKESGPWGLKIRTLARVAEKFGCRVISLDDQGVSDPALRVRHLVETAGAVAAPLILVGSSMGGYVAAVASSTLRPRGLFLMAPAIGVPGYAIEAPVPVADEMFIVQGWDDEVVPLGPVLAFAKTNRCPISIIADGHALHGRLDELEQMFTDFLARCLSVPARGTGRARLLATL
jgi:pimeloyl-ACP methyl ester carboxylesterase